MSVWTDDHELCQREAEGLRMAGRELRSLLLMFHSCDHEEDCDVYQAVKQWEKVDPF